ncbi:PTS sugar transporter subunit IIA [Rathayibacter tanaceti]|uniref:Ascorbate-specific PTS system EIIA component n=1 Tax=Rathayibacter tanaceti TaxID=1671680 RepID=A0A162J1P5_9MICO|nr:PTS sugar transporter subunit IIA [Rathayibacter tanaceti]KZX20897.1 Ascorbate-specific phosphotransferase enzyme IIA component [Rathayibacter tanaceti]
MPLDALADEAVALRHSAASWREAVLEAGRALERTGAVEAAYSRRMIEQVDVLGPYIVIAPGLALAHARPGHDVLADGLSVVTLAEPVPFGHSTNDPVSVVIGIAATQSHGHLASSPDSPTCSAAPTR